MPDLPSRRQREREIEAAMLILLQKQYDHLVDDPSTPPWAAWEQETTDALVQPLTDTYSEAFERLGKQQGLGMDSDEIKQLATVWALLYAGNVAREVVGSTREATQAALRTAAVDGVSRAEALAPTFAVPRVERVSITEVTRAVTAGEREAAARIARAEVERAATDDGRIGIKPLDAVLIAIWNTEQDGLVCPVCRPLHGTKERDWPFPIDGPPAHPRCRCWVEWKAPRA